jgi:hypothetical protein
MPAALRPDRDDQLLRVGQGRQTGAHRLTVHGGAGAAGRTVPVTMMSRMAHKRHLRIGVDGVLDAVDLICGKEFSD